jgi:hypothetical protein
MFGWTIDKAKNMMEELAAKLTSGELLDSKNNKEAKELDEKFADERHSLLWEVTESAMARWTPWLSKFMDLGTSLGVGKWDSEAVRWQKEFESITAWTMFIPDRLLKYATNPVLKIPWFKTVVENYPVWGKAKDKLLEDLNSWKDADPDNIINFLRLVHQDMITWVVTYKKVAN